MMHRSFAISPSSMSIRFREKAIQRELHRDVIRCRSVFSWKPRFREIFSFIVTCIPDQTFVSAGEIIILCHTARNNEGCRFETLIKL